MSDKKRASDRETEALDPDGQPALEGCILYVSDGPAEDCGKSVKLERGRVRIGSDPTCELQLVDSAVSGIHAELSARTHSVLVRDLDSKNGVRFLGQKIETAELKPGARLTIGRCSIDILPLTESRAVAVSGQTSYGELLGTSLGMRRLYTLLERLEATEAPILIHGETGVGKELLAKAIHDHSPRATGLAVDQNRRLGGLESFEQRVEPPHAQARSEQLAIARLP